MVRTTLGAEVETTVSVAGSESVEFIDAGTSTSIPTGSAFSKSVRPPAGFLYELINFRFIVQSPGGNSSDVHKVVLRSQSQQIGLLFGASSGNQPLEFQNSTFRSADNTKTPTSESAQITALKGSRISSTAGLELVYTNLSGATVTSGIQFGVWVRRIEVEDS